MACCTLYDMYAHVCIGQMTDGMPTTAVSSSIHTKFLWFSAKPPEGSPGGGRFGGAVQGCRVSTVPCSPTTTAVVSSIQAMSPR